MSLQYYPVFLQAISKRWLRHTLLFICGLLATLSLPPFFWSPLLIPAICGLFLIMNEAPTIKRAFWDGWWWGWGFYMGGLYWFCIALLTDAEKFAWLIPFALFGLTGVIAIYSGIITAITKALRISGIWQIALFVLVWTVVEYGRGHLFTGFPWNLAGYTFAGNDAAIQLASIIGAYGLTLIAVWLAIVPVLLIIQHKHGWKIIITSYAFLAVAIGWGSMRLATADQLPEAELTVPGVMMRLVQANILQHHKWDPRLQFKGLEEQVRLSNLPGAEKVTHIIWPETAMPYVLSDQSPVLEFLAESIPPHTELLAGTMTARRGC